MRYLIAAVFPVLLCGQPALRLKVPLPETPVAIGAKDGQTGARPLTRIGAPDSRDRHLILQFAATPDDAVRSQLATRGVKLLADLPDAAVLATIDGSADVSGLGVIYAGPLAASSKISPLLSGDGRISTGGYALVEFHPDVDPGVARSLVLAAGLELRDNPDLGPHRLLVRQRVSYRASSRLPLLAAHDEVAYIFPASEDLIAGRPTVPCLSAILGDSAVGQYIETIGDGWDGSGQGSATLSFSFGAMTSKLSADAARGEILRAMQEWSKAAAVTWVEGGNASTAHAVHILFGSRSHGDRFPFDGPGSVLAHTFYPAPPNPEPIAGDMHLDADEGWRIGANTDLFSVALHELGHALGLAHSDDPDAVMYPYYRMASTLADDDRAAIQRLYAAAAASPAPPVTPSDPSPSDPQPGDPEPDDPTPADPQPPANPDPPGQPAPGDPSDPSPPDPAPPGPGDPAPPPQGDTTAPSLTISSPASTSVSTSQAEYEFAGESSDAGGVAKVTWENFAYSGTAHGTTRWSATVPLLRGFNRVTIRATDNAGNSSWRTVVVNRR